MKGIKRTGKKKIGVLHIYTDIPGTSLYNLIRFVKEKGKKNLKPEQIRWDEGGGEVCVERGGEGVGGGGHAYRPIAIVE